MSFILDALKKSEAERQRQAGPTLLELRITRPRRRYPLWAAIVGVLLGVNIVVLLALVLRGPVVAFVEGSSPSAAASAAPSVQVSAGPSGRQAAAVRPVEPISAPVPSAAAASVVAGVPVVPARLSAAGAAGDNGAIPAGNEQLRNPADDEPAVASSRVQVQPPGTDDYANLPSSGEVGGNIPPLQLDLLDYSDRPGERYALINMHRVHEGDVLPEGARVLAITRDGVALDYHGQNFMLHPGGAPP